MAQPEFLLNCRWRKPARIFQAATIKVEHPEIRKVRHHTFGGLQFGHSIGTGRFDRRTLDITSPDISSYLFRVADTAEAVKGGLRRIRAQEAAALDDIDSDIEQTQAHLTVLQDRRKLALHGAWQHGNVVRLNEVERLLPAAAASTER